MATSGGKGLNYSYQLLSPEYLLLIVSYFTHKRSNELNAPVKHTFDSK